MSVPTIAFINTESLQIWEKLDEISSNMSGGLTIGKPSSEFTRPANVVAYSEGDEVSNDPDAVAPVLAWTIDTTVDKKVILLGAQLIVDAKVAAPLPDLELYLFSSQITCDGDNDPFNPSGADIQTLLAVVSFQDIKVVGDRMVADALMNCEEVVLTPAATTSSVFGVLVCNSAWTPAASMTFKIFLNTKRS